MIFNRSLLIIIAGLLLMLSLTGWMLKKSIQKNGELSQITDQYARANVVLAESVQQAYREKALADAAIVEDEQRRRQYQKQLNDYKRAISELSDANENIKTYREIVIPADLYQQFIRVRRGAGDQ